MVQELCKRAVDAAFFEQLGETLCVVGLFGGGEGVEFGEAAGDEGFVVGEALGEPDIVLEGFEELTKCSLRPGLMSCMTMVAVAR